MNGETQQASISRFNKIGKYFIHSFSKIKMGGSIATEPYIWLDVSTPLGEVVKQLLYALTFSKSGLPNPTNWEASSKDFLKSAGLKKSRDLFENVISVGVIRKQNTIIFTPLINMGNKGFVNVPNGKIEISEDKELHEIALALEEALNKSE